MWRVKGGCQRNNFAYHVDCVTDTLFSKAQCKVDYSPEFKLIIIIFPSIIIGTSLFCLMCIKVMTYFAFSFLSTFCKFCHQYFVVYFVLIISDSVEYVLDTNASIVAEIVVIDKRCKVLVYHFENYSIFLLLNVTNQSYFKHNL